MRKLSLPFIFTILATSVQAQDDEKRKSEFEIGAISTSGNTQTQSVKSTLDIKYDLPRWHNNFILQALMKRDEIETEEGERIETTTAERYFASAKADYILNSEHAAFFMFADYDRNRFSGFDYQYSFAIGYTNRLFTTDNAYLTYDLGPGITVSQREEIEGEPQPEEEESMVVRVAAEYVYEFSDNASFKQTLSSNVATESDKNTRTKSETSITAKINSSLALRASYIIDYNSEVPEDRENEDTQTALTVVYSF